MITTLEIGENVTIFGHGQGSSFIIQGIIVNIDQIAIRCFDSGRIHIMPWSNIQQIDVHPMAETQP